MSKESDVSNPVRIEDLLAHAGWVRALALRLVRDAAAADDVVQEAWLAALHNPPRGDRPVKPWLAGVVRNLVRMRARGAGRRAKHESVPRGADRPLPSPDTLAERLELQQEVAKHVSSLAEPLRSTLLLRYYEGLSAAEIARRLGLPAGTVRWRLKRGLDELRTRLDEQHGGNRRAWCLALIPLAETDAPRPPAAPGTLAAITQGAVVMGLLSKGAVATAGAAVLILGLAWSTGMLESGGEGLDPEAVEQVSFRPIRQRSRTPGPDDVAAADAAAPVATDADTSPDESTDAERTASVWATLIDTDGRPVKGAVLEAHGVPGGGSARSDAAGRVAMVLSLPDTSWSVRFRAGGDGFAWHRVEAVLVAGKDVPLGEIRLAPGGAVSGRVVGRDGRPVPGSWVGVGDGDFVGVPLEQMRRWRRHGLSGDLATTVAPDGTFRLQGVPVGRQRLWAGESDHLATPSRLVEIRAGQESYGLELVLDPLDPEDVIEGVVLAPDGTPVSRADMRYQFSGSWGRNGSGTFHADEQGRFRVVVRFDGTYGFTAGDPAGRWGGASIEDVPPGRRDVVLRLPENRYVPLVVRDRSGAPVSRFAFTVLSKTAPAVFDVAPVADHPGGRARVRLPAQVFQVVVDAAGYDEVELGPFDPASPPPSITADLVALPGLRGLVTADGQPVAGARVSVHAAVPAGRRWTHNGFVTRWNPQSAVAGTTDDRGRFALTLRESGGFVIRVEADGYAPFEWGPEELDHRLGRAGLEIVLDVGGTLEGIVRAEAGRSAAGTLVAISRGDGFARTQRVDADGAFRFGHLTPGPWIVRRHDEEIRPGNSSTTMSSGRAEFAWNAHVTSGAVTRIDLGTVPATAGRLTGRLLLAGASPSDWVARLDRGGGAVRLEETPAARLDEDGRFELTAPTPGTYRLSMLARDGSLVVLVPGLTVEAGGTRYELEIAFGCLEGAGAAAGGDPDAPMPELALLTEADDGALVIAPIRVDGEGRFVLERAPAGRGRIARIEDSGAESPDSWPTLAEVTIVAGETAHVRLAE